MGSRRNWGKRLGYWDWTPGKITSMLCDGMCVDNGFGVVNVGVLNRLIHIPDIKFVRECMLLGTGILTYQGEICEMRQSFDIDTIRHLLAHIEHRELIPKEYVRVFDPSFDWTDLRICDEKREDLEDVLKTARKGKQHLTYEMLADGIKYFEYRYKNIDEGYTNEICDPKRETCADDTPHARVSYKNGVWHLVGVTNRVPDRNCEKAYCDLKREFDSCKEGDGRRVEAIVELEKEHKELDEYERTLSKQNERYKRVETYRVLISDYERAIKAYKLAMAKGRPLEEGIELPPVRTYHYL